MSLRTDLEQHRGAIRIARARAHANKVADHVRTSPPPSFYGSRQLDEYQSVRGLVLNAAIAATHDAGITEHQVVTRFSTLHDSMHFMVVADKEELDLSSNVVEASRGFSLEYTARGGLLSRVKPHLSLHNRDWLIPTDQRDPVALEDPDQALDMLKAQDRKFGYISVQLYQLTPQKVRSLIVVGLSHPDLLRHP